MNGKRACVYNGNELSGNVHVMTVCVSIKSQDCIVFAADSASTVIDPTGTGQINNVWLHGEKIYNLSASIDLPVVGMSCGAGGIGPNSMTGLMRDLRQKILAEHEARTIQVNTARKPPLTVNEISGMCQEFLIDECEKRYGALEESSPLIKFFIGGYEGSEAGGKIINFTVPAGQQPQAVLVKPEDPFMINYGGQSEAIDRLLWGISGHALKYFNVDVASDEGRELFNLCHARLGDSTMPPQDAIDLAEFLVDCTAKFHRFSPRANVVGGPVDIAVITRHDGFRWIKRKQYFSHEKGERGLKQ